MIRPKSINIDSDADVYVDYFRFALETYCRAQIAIGKETIARLMLECYGFDPDEIDRYIKRCEWYVRARSTCTCNLPSSHPEDV